MSYFNKIRKRNDKSSRSSSEEDTPTKKLTQKDIVILNKDNEDMDNSGSETAQQTAQQPATMQSLAKQIQELQISQNKQITNLQKSQDQRYDALEKSIQELKTSQDDLKQTLTSYIQNEMQKAKEELTDTVTNKVADMRKDFENRIGTIDLKIRASEAECRKIVDMNDRISSLEDKTSASGDNYTDPCDNANITVVCEGVPMSGESDLVSAKNIISALGPAMNTVMITGAKRLHQRFPHSGKPPLLKIAFRNVDEKRTVLNNKQTLRKHPSFSKVFLRSSQTHADRIQYLNARTILGMMPDGNKSHYVASHGKIVPKSHQQHRGPHDLSSSPPESQTAADRQRREDQRERQPRPIAPPPAPPQGQSPPSWVEQSSTAHQQNSIIDHHTNSKLDDISLNRASANVSGK